MVPGREESGCWRAGDGVCGVDGMGTGGVRYVPGNSPMASALPPEVKQASASQQEISNHFSDTKATGIRCRSEEEGLQRAEKGACTCWYVTHTGQAEVACCKNQHFRGKKEETSKVML